MSGQAREDLPGTSSNQIQSHYTVFIRLPFPRGEFVDPSPIEWDVSKDGALWNILSGVSKGHEVNWQGLADKFGVTLPFLLQQSAWLYEQQLSHVKDQLRKATRPVSISSPPASGSASASGFVGGHAMIRGGSSGSRALSALLVRIKERPNSQGEGNLTESAPKNRGPHVSRNSSTHTMHRVPRLSPTLPHHSPVIEQRDDSRKSAEQPQIRKLLARDLALDQSHTKEGSSSSSPSSSDSDSLVSTSRSRAFLRPSRYSSSKRSLRPLSDADEDQEDSTPFLPFSDAQTLKTSNIVDPSATVRMASDKSSSDQSALSTLPNREPPLIAQTANSSSSSAQSQIQPRSQSARSGQGPLSSLSPRQRRITKEGSEGSPSMGSSFSDLDDASVTQSALEEALVNEMNHGGATSRISTISQALRSKYL